MAPKLSQPTLGILRKCLEEWQPPNLHSMIDIRKFWRDELFDTGFAPAFIDIASSYDFNWSKIIPDLFIGRFGSQNSYFSNALAPSLCEQNLKRLLVFALRAYKGTQHEKLLREALISDGFDSEPSKVDSSVPAEPAQILGEKTSVSSDIQKDGSEVLSIVPDEDHVAKGKEPESVNFDPTPKWNRGEKIAAWTLVIAVLALVAAFLVVPEFRKFVGLDRESSISAPTTTPTSATPNNKMFGLFARSVEELRKHNNVTRMKDTESGKMLSEIPFGSFGFADEIEMRRVLKTLE